jgi:serralysin
MAGGFGNDNMSGGGGGDNDMSGQEGADTMSGGSSADAMDGGAGAERMDGGDCMLAGFGDDSALGGNGNDVILGQEGNDTLDGGGWNDSLDGGAGNDSLRGGDGDDWIARSSGSDTATGGAGADVFVFREDEDDPGTINYINDWDAGDVVVLRGQSPFFYSVTKIDYAADGNDGVEDDVRISINDGSFIYIRGAAADFVEGVGSQLELVPGNADDFVHRAGDDPACFVSCPAPLLPPALPVIEFCYDPIAENGA